MLNYAFESLLSNHSQLIEFNVCWNNVFSNVFKMHKRESIKLVQYYCDRLDIIGMLHLEKLKFVAKLCNNGNNVNHICLAYFSH